MTKSEKKSGKNTILIIVVLLVIAAAAVYFIFFRNGGLTGGSEKKNNTAETQKATEFSITPADEEDAALFTDSLVGVWTSYTEEGEPYTYSFEKDGSLHYQQEGKDSKEYTYSFEDGLLTVKDSKRTHVYQLSKDAVGMMARLHNGEWQNDFAIIAEDIPNFGGCVYIADGIMYLGDKCMCKNDALDDFDGKSLEGEWVGVVGDTVDFAADGSYTYIKNADTFKGSYAVDFDKNTLDITINGTTNAHDKDSWGISGRVLHIGKQYYFKVL